MANVENSDAEEFWSGPSGLNWIEYETEQDAILAAAAEEVMVRAIPSAGESVLDIGCGTGALSLACSRAVGETGRVLATDISAPLLARAAERGAHLPQMGTFLADAQVATWPETGFDLAVSRFGVMFFTDPPAAFANIARALRPGGRMVFAAWAPYAKNPWWQIPQRAATTRLGHPPKVLPNTPGPMGLSGMEWALDQLRAAGLRDVAGSEVETTLTYPGGAVAVATLATRVGPARRVINHFNGTREDARVIAARIAEEIARYDTGGIVAIPATLNLLTATRG